MRLAAYLSEPARLAGGLAGPDRLPGPQPVPTLGGLRQAEVVS